MRDTPSRFGPYEIVSPLGAGGMGQVYRARDTRLQRTVALKILHESTAVDPDRRRRFAREAIAASALNHPNILTVFDVGIEGDTPYLVSELIEGQSLRAEMNQGRVPLRRTVEIAQQIAEGLAAAHDAGIVHRDLKPENVMVTREGRLKIVDFGLASAQGTEPSHDLTSATGTAPVSLDTETASGLIVGTVPYMSPEQARGEKADFRSDQFALGVVLYELTTATHPFKRGTAVQTLSAIMGDDPPEPAPPGVVLPVTLRWLIRRLLAKSPRDRYAHTADVAADLRTLREYFTEAIAPTPVAEFVGDPAAKRLRRLAIPAALVGAALALGLVAGPGDANVHFNRFTPFATDAGYQGAPAWSPDGTEIAYEAEVNGVIQIFKRSLGAALRTKVTNSASHALGPTWSSDGYIYYLSQARDSGAVFRVTPVGGEPQLVVEDAQESSHVSPDGKTIALLRPESKRSVSLGLWLFSLPDGPPRRYDRGALKGLAGSSGLVRFSPDGSRLLVWLATTGDGRSGIWVVPMPDGEPRPLLPGFGNAGQVPPLFSWLPDNRHVVITRSDGPTPGTHLWLADTETNRVLPITATPGNEGAPTVSPDGGTIAFTYEATDFDIVEVPLDGSPPRPFLSSTRNEFDPAASPVNTQYAYVTDRTGHLQIWLQNEEGYLQQPLVAESAFPGAPSMAVGSLAFSPDGRRLAFQRAAGVDVTGAASAAGGPTAGSRLWVASVSGGAPVPATNGRDGDYEDAPTWSPDGEWIAYLFSDKGGLGLAKSRVGTRGAPVVLLATGTIPWFVARPQWSPDGSWILCETVEGLMLVAADGKTSRVLSEDEWLAYAWGEDGRQIYGLREGGTRVGLVAIDSQTGAERLINGDLGTVPQAPQPIRGFSRLRGRGFLTSIARVRSDIYLIEGFRKPPALWERFWPFRPAPR